MEKIVEIKKCRFCSSSFEITDKDLEFYDKVSPVFSGKKYNIPTPTLCPDCRQQRRFSWRNVRKVYMINSDLSGKKILSIFKPNSGYVVYSPNELLNLEFDILNYGKDFDFKKGFFEQFNELLHKVPLPSTSILQNTIENSDYINGANNVKNSYLSFNLANCDKVLYSEGTYFCNNIIDCYINKKSENCYECINCNNVYLCFYSVNLQDSNNCFFCSNSININNCIGCINLVNKSYCIFNKQYTKEEYEEKKQLLLSDLSLLKEKVNNFFKNQIKKENFNINYENSIGEYLYNVKDCFDCYNINDGENLKYCYFINNGGYNSYDISVFGQNINNCYEGTAIGNNVNNCLFNYIVHGNVSNLIYCYNCVNNCSNCFGCISLDNKQYCILNKQYTKEEYEELVPRIIEHMTSPQPSPAGEGVAQEWGEFFPSSMSPFGYNETVAQEYYPISSPPAREGLGEGVRFNWSTYEPPFPKVEKIISASKLPDNIVDIPDDILNWAIECEVTKKPFRIIKQELEFYRKHNLPIPRRHPDQRHLDRMALRNPRKLFDRKCDKCGKDMKTTYNPERKEIVYCEECYNKEVY